MPRIKGAVLLFIAVMFALYIWRHNKRKKAE
jgi:hypothetical protein